MRLGEPVMNQPVALGACPPAPPTSPKLPLLGHPPLLANSQFVEGSPRPKPRIHPPCPPPNCGCLRG